MGIPEDFNDDWKFYGELRYDFSEEGEERYSEIYGISIKDLPQTEKELISLLNKLNLNPKELKIYELTGHYESDYDYCDGENIQITYLNVDCEKAISQENIDWLIERYNQP